MESKILLYATMASVSRELFSIRANAAVTPMFSDLGAVCDACHNL